MSEIAFLAAAVSGKRDKLQRMISKKNVDVDVRDDVPPSFPSFNHP